MLNLSTLFVIFFSWSSISFIIFCINSEWFFRNIDTPTVGLVIFSMITLPMVLIVIFMSVLFYISDMIDYSFIKKIWNKPIRFKK